MSLESLNRKQAETCQEHFLGGLLGTTCMERHALGCGILCDKRHNTECHARRFEASSQEGQELRVPARAFGLGNGSPSNAGGRGLLT